MPPMPPMAPPAAGGGSTVNIRIGSGGVEGGWFKLLAMSQKSLGCQHVVLDANNGGDEAKTGEH